MKKEKNNILLLPGDGVGPEIMAEAVKLIDYFNHENSETNVFILTETRV